MKNLSNEATRYMMDTLAYGLVAGCAKNGQELTKQEIDSLSRMLFTLYCEHENLIPDYEGIGSKNDIEDTNIYEEEIDYDEDEDEYEEDYNEDITNDIDDYDDDSYEDDNENFDDNDDDIMEMFRIFEN